TSLAQIIRGWATTGWDGGCNHISEIEQGISGFRGTAHLAFVPGLLGALADALIRLQRYASAMESVQQAFEIMEATDERNCEAELLRLKGVCCWEGSNSPDEANALFQHGIAVAQRQESRSAELKLAVDL